MHFKNAKPATVQMVFQSSCSDGLISSAVLDENFLRAIPEHNLFRAGSVSQVGTAHPMCYLGWCVEILYRDGVSAYVFIGAVSSTYLGKRSRVSSPRTLAAYEARKFSAEQSS